MKKILFAIALVITMGLSASAQRDGFFGEYANNDDRWPSGGPGLVMPNDNIGSTENADAPLGTGLLIMTALGGAYMLRKREK